MATVITSFAADGVATIGMADAASANALSRDMVRALEQAFGTVAQDGSTRCVLLTGLPEIFCSGASRELLEDLAGGRLNPGEILLPRLPLECPVPCIAAMEGHAVGGGLALGVAADIVLMAEESRYALNFMNLGLTPGMGTTRLLEHVLSPAVAHELLYSGEARRGRDFLKAGGINHIVPRAEVLPLARDLASRIADKHRDTLIALKRTLSVRRREAFESARTQEALMHSLCLAQPDTHARIREQFPEVLPHPQHRG